MAMTEHTLAVERRTFVWGGVFGLAALLRLVMLGWPPLGDVEARAALSAAKGALASPFWTSNGAWGGAAYQTLAGWVFQVFGTSDAAARWIPALAGVGLVAIPWLLRRRLGEDRALLLALFLTISPAMLSAARMAGGTSLAVLGVGQFVALALSNQLGATRRFAWMGVGLGLALAGGASAWEGLVSLAIAAAWVAWRTGRTTHALDWIPDNGWRTLVLALLVTYLGLTVQFGAAMQGLGVALQSPAQWLATWTGPGTLPLLTAVVLLPAYEPLILAFGLTGALRLQKEDVIWRGARAWAVTAAVLFLVRPARTSEDLVWVVLPLAVLATVPLSSLLEVLADGLEDLSVYVMAGVLLALAGFTYIQAAGYINVIDIGGSPQMVTLGLVLTALGFAVSLFLLYGMTWSWTEALHSLGAAGGVLLTLLTLSAGWRLAFSPRSTGGPELWRPTAASQDLRLMETTLAQISIAQRGEAGNLPIRVDTQPPPALAWILRHDVIAQPDAAGGGPPQVILLPSSDSQPSLPGTYLGQSFGVETAWGWQGALPPDGIGWWILRKGTGQSIDWVLFAHTDAPPASQGG